MSTTFCERLSADLIVSAALCHEKSILNRTVTTSYSRLFDTLEFLEENVAIPIRANRAELESIVFKPEKTSKMERQIN